MVPKKPKVPLYAIKTFCFRKKQKGLNIESLQFEPPSHVSKKQLNSDLTSKFGRSAIILNLHLLFEKTLFIYNLSLQYL